MIAAYRDTLVAEGGRPPALDDESVQLDCCRLHLAVRWSCRPPGWEPPAHQAFDWPAEVRRLAAILGLRGIGR
jgi:hypothetical protein